LIQKKSGLKEKKHAKLTKICATKKIYDSLLSCYAAPKKARVAVQLERRDPVQDRVAARQPVAAGGPVAARGPARPARPQGPGGAPGAAPAPQRAVAAAAARGQARPAGGQVSNNRPITIIGCDWQSLAIGMSFVRFRTIVLGCPAVRKKFFFNDYYIN